MRPVMPGMDLEHGQLPDPVLRGLSKVMDRQSRLEERVLKLEGDSVPVIPTSESVILHPQEDDIRQALKEVIDPEVGVSVVDLGLIRKIVLNGNGIEVRMVLTSLSCPLAEHLVEQVRRKVRTVVGSQPVEVVLADEVWSWSDAAPWMFQGDGI